MVKVNIRDKNFIQYDKSSCHLATNQHVEWVPDNTPVGNSCFITDLCLTDVHKAAGVNRKIAWILEPRSIHPHVYSWIEQYNNLFDFVLTFDNQLISKGQNYLYYPHGRCWIHDYSNIDQKTEMCSIFASDKSYTVGHRLRHDVVNRFKNSSVVDLKCFGQYCGNRIEKKEDGLNKFRYSITIENAIIPGYWTEKLLDCFATKTIPIFYGDEKSVSKYFDADGIIFFDDINQLDSILKSISKDHYDSKYNAINNNFNSVEKFRVPEDWIFENYPFLFE